MLLTDRVLAAKGAHVRGHRGGRARLYACMQSPDVWPLPAAAVCIDGVPAGYVAVMIGRRDMSAEHGEELCRLLVIHFFFV